MIDLESLEKEIKKTGNADKLKGLAATPEGQRVLKSLNIGALEKAVKNGDNAALQGVITDLLKTSDGQVLYKKITDALNIK